MRTVEISMVFPTLDKLLELVDEIVILRTSDGRQFVLTEVDDFDKEVTLASQNPELIEFLAHRSREEKVHSLDQVRERLDLL